MTEDQHDIEIGSDYDPGTGETLHDAAGAPVTSDYLDRAVEDAEAGFELATARRVGRPSLTGDSRHSPRVSFRVSVEVRAKAERIADEQGKTVSQLAREALERYLAS